MGAKPSGAFLERLEAGREVAQLRGLLGDSEAAQVGGAARHRANNLDHVVDVRLRVNPPGDGQAHQLHRPGRLRPVGMHPEHDRADLAAADAALPVQGDRQRLPGILERRDVREERGRIEVDGVAADRLHAGDAGLDQRLAQVGG
jgi:hypothetical protein